MLCGVQGFWFRLNLLRSMWHEQANFVIDMEVICTCICREPAGLAQQLFTQHLARPIPCDAYDDALSGHTIGWEGPEKLSTVVKTALARTDDALKAAAVPELQTAHDSVHPFENVAVCTRLRSFANLCAFVLQRSMHACFD
jgi:hypothetical protein